MHGYNAIECYTARKPLSYPSVADIATKELQDRAMVWCFNFVKADHGRCDNH